MSQTMKDRLAHLEQEVQALRTWKGKTSEWLWDLQWDLHKRHHNEPRTTAATCPYCFVTAGEVDSKERT
jgi:hypothetical protein